MSRMLHRAVAALLAVPLAAAVGIAPAAADDVTVPGCYGVSVVVCDPTVEYAVPAGVETYSTVIPVCAGSCEDVRVTLVRLTGGEPLSVCVSYESRTGAVTRQCADVPDAGALVDVVVGLIVDTIADITRELPDTDALIEDILEGIRELGERLPTRDEIEEALARAIERALERIPDTSLEPCDILGCTSSR